MLWLDHLLFGNGRGMKSPHADSLFYWLDGRFYGWSGWFGCQLQSFEWRRMPAGTRRRLVDRDFVVVATQRRWLRVRTTWSMTGNPTSEEIRSLRSDLNAI